MNTRGRIVLIEDNDATRYAVTRILAKAGFDTSPAEDGESGIALVASARPDLVLLDVKLPDLSGFEVARRLKGDPDTAVIPVVHLSAMSVTAAEQVRGLEGGADAYLTHPVEPRVLVATIDALLRARRAERRYRRVFDTGLLGIVSWDAGGTIVDANDAFLSMVGHDRADLTAGQLAWKHLVFDGPSGEGQHELTLVRRDGTRVPVIAGRASHVEGDPAVAFVLDNTHRKRAEEALQEADRRKDEFLAVLSHELRNPLAPIRNAIAILGRTAPESGQASRARQILDRQTAHLTHLVDDLLDVTRISRGKITLQPSRLDLRDVVRRATDDVRFLFEHARIQLRVEQPPGEVWVNADRTRVSQVVSNLLQNAVKFTPAGGAVTVTVGLTRRTAELRVRDDGMGMEPDEVARMFEPFAQSDRSLARTKGGLGLGLPLVRGIVELHGGTVSARSEGPGHGSEFLVSLPRAETGPAEPAGTDREARRGGARVVVIEDNADAATSLGDLLELRGHQVWIAPDGETGLARVRELTPDVVLCDIGLPDIDGYAVARTLRSDARLASTRLVALSGYAHPEDRERALAAGFDAHLAKPPRLEALEEVLAKAPCAGAG